MTGRLIDAATGEVVLGRIERADTFWQRFWGLQFRSGLSADTGLLMTPCSSLHTCFMRFTIDVIMLGNDGEVVGVERSVRPWRVVLCRPGTRSVIETCVGALVVVEGNRLVVSQ